MSKDDAIILSDSEEVIVEEMAKAAYVAYVMDGREPWWDINNPEEASLSDPSLQWPDDVGTHIGAKGFRSCAKAAYLVVQKNMLTVANEAN